MYPFRFTQWQNGLDWKGPQRSPSLYFWSVTSAPSWDGPDFVSQVVDTVQRSDAGSRLFQPWISLHGSSQQWQLNILTEPFHQDEQLDVDHLSNEPKCLPLLFWMENAVLHSTPKRQLNLWVFTLGDSSDAEGLPWTCFRSRVGGKGTYPAVESPSVWQLLWIKAVTCAARLGKEKDLVIKCETNSTIYMFRRY